MRDDVRGYLAAALDQARRAGRLAGLQGGVDAFATALTGSDPLRRALTDSSVPAAQRRAVVLELLADRGSPEVAPVAAYVVTAERAGELPAVMAQVRVQVEDDLERANRGEEPPSEPAGGRAAVRERMEGYADFVFAGVRNMSELDEIEDQLFKVARLVESNRDLDAALGNPEVPLAARRGIVRDLLRGKVRAEAECLLEYLLRAGRVRSLVRTIDWLVELVAVERGRRIAEVRSATDLDAAQRERLAAALVQVAMRPVELRVTVDPSVIGGMVVSLGDTIIDGTVQHRLAQLRDVLSPAGLPAA
jgi:F-type H+-transporting ATPase subunit delta